MSTRNTHISFTNAQIRNYNMKPPLRPPCKSFLLYFLHKIELPCGKYERNELAATALMDGFFLLEMFVVILFIYKISSQEETQTFLPQQFASTLNFCKTYKIQSALKHDLQQSLPKKQWYATGITNVSGRLHSNKNPIMLVLKMRKVMKFVILVAKKKEIAVVTSERLSIATTVTHSSA
jgi:hypothetical protein